MASPLAALAALQIQGTQSSGNLLFGTVSSASLQGCQVLVDGATTPVTAAVGVALQPRILVDGPGANPSNGPAVGARVVGQRIGSQFYIQDLLSGGAALNQLAEARTASTAAVTTTSDIVTGWSDTTGPGFIPVSKYGTRSGGQVTITTGGLYTINVALNMTIAANSRASIFLAKNGVIIGQGASFVGATSRVVTPALTLDVPLVVGDVIDVRASVADATNLSGNNNYQYWQMVRTSGLAQT